MPAESGRSRRAKLVGELIFLQKQSARESRGGFGGTRNVEALLRLLRLMRESVQWGL